MTRRSMRPRSSASTNSASSGPGRGGRWHRLASLLQDLICAPRMVSSVVPSFAALARAMVAGLGPQTGPVAESGPGTAVMTQAMIDAGLPPRSGDPVRSEPHLCIPSAHPLSRRGCGERRRTDHCRALPRWGCGNRDLVQSAARPGLHLTPRVIEVMVCDGMPIDFAASPSYEKPHITQERAR